VVAREIGKDRRRKVQSSNAMLVHGVTTDFHDSGWTARCDTPRSPGRNLIGHGRCQAGWHRGHAIVDRHTAEQAAWLRHAKDRMQQRCQGGFPIGASDSHEAKRTRWIAEQSVG
jgi:hypothetical protein